MPKATIDELIAQHEIAPHERLLQKKLAEAITCFVHSEEDYQFALKATDILFGNATTDVLQSLNETQLMQVLEGVPTAEVAQAQVQEGYDIVSFLADTQIFPSKGEARKMWQAGGISLNKSKVSPEKTMITSTDLLQQKYLLVQKGKKNYYLVKAV